MYDLLSYVQRTITNPERYDYSCIGSYAFAFNNYFVLRGIFPDVEFIGSNAFYQTGSRTQLYSGDILAFPKCSKIGDRAFYGDATLRNVDIPLCEELGSEAFRQCLSLTTINAPMVKELKYAAFYACSLQSAIFPECSIIGSEAFENTFIESTNFDKVGRIGQSAFLGCTHLTTLSFPECSYIANYAFYSCSRLESLYLTGKYCIAERSIFDTFGYRRIHVYLNKDYQTSYANAAWVKSISASRVHYV